MADTPKLDAAFGELAQELADAYAAIPTIEVSVQHLDQNDKPSGKPYTIRSKNGVIDLGFQTLTVSEFLLWVQSQELRPERGFIFGTSWLHPSWGSGRSWPSDTVKYYFHSSISDEDRTWMWWKLHRTQHATGVTFAEYAYSGSREHEWQRGPSRYLRISREELGSTRGTATVGKVSKSFLKMDHGQTHNSTGEHTFYHETGHVLGLLHERQREDRDTYVYVSRSGTNWDRLFVWRNKTILCIFGWCWTTAVQNSTMYDTPYDYHSVSHYESDTGSITLRPSGNTWDVWSKNKSVWGAENHYTYFTPWDIYVIKRRYGIRPNLKPTYTPTSAYPSS